LETWDGQEGDLMTGFALEVGQLLLKGACPVGREHAGEVVDAPTQRRDFEGERERTQDQERN
jgi:hypothetical protein